MLFEQEEEWLYNSDKEGATTEDFEKRCKSLEEKTVDMKIRKKEHEQFPTYIAKLKTFITNTTVLVGKLRRERKWIPSNQTEAVQGKLKELSEWVSNKTKERRVKPLTSDPVLTKAMMLTRTGPIKEMIKAMERIEKPKPKKPAKPAKNKTAKANKTGDEDEDSGIDNDDDKKSKKDTENDNEEEDEENEAETSSSDNSTAKNNNSDAGKQ